MERRYSTVSGNGCKCGINKGWNKAAPLLCVKTLQDGEMKTPQLLDGRAVRDAIRKRLKKEFAMHKRTPTLAIVQVGDNAASSAYIKQKILFGKSVGARVIHKKLPAHADEGNVSVCINALAVNPAVAGIIVQLPLPPPPAR